MLCTSTCHALSLLLPLHVPRMTFHLSHPEKHSITLYDLGLVVSCEYIFWPLSFVLGKVRPYYGLDSNGVYSCCRLSPFIIPLSALQCYCLNFWGWLSTLVFLVSQKKWLVHILECYRSLNHVKVIKIYIQSSNILKRNSLRW